MERITCPKCGGIRFIDSFKHVEGGVCFECGGSGYIEIDTEIEKIKENKKKINREKSVKKQKETLLKSLKKDWFNNEDVIYIVNEKNTYALKDKIKKDGGKFNKFSVWYFTERKEGYNLIEITWNEVLNDNDEGYAVRFAELIKGKSNGNLRGF